MCSTALTETIEYYVSRQIPVYVLLIDASKAFDRVSHIKLFNILLFFLYILFVYNCIFCVLLCKKYVRIKIYIYIYVGAPVCMNVIYNVMATTIPIIKCVCESNNSCIAKNMLTGNYV